MLKAAASSTSLNPVCVQAIEAALINKVKVTLVPVIYTPLCTFTCSFSQAFSNLGTVHIRIQAIPATVMFKCGCTLVQVPAYHF